MLQNGGWVVWEEEDYIKYVQIGTLTIWDLMVWWIWSIVKTLDTVLLLLELVMITFQWFNQSCTNNNVIFYHYNVIEVVCLYSLLLRNISLKKSDTTRYIYISDYYIYKFISLSEYQKNLFRLNHIHNYQDIKFPSNSVK